MEMAVIPNGYMQSSSGGLLKAAKLSLVVHLAIPNRLRKVKLCFQKGAASELIKLSMRLAGLISASS